MLRDFVIAGILLLPLTVTAASDTAANQFEDNANLAGRALACGDRAGHAALRSVSSQLASLLPESRSLKQHMAYFDAKVGRQQRFSDGVDPSGSACRRNTEKLQDSLDRTTYIIRTDA